MPKDKETPNNHNIYSKSHSKYPLQTIPMQIAISFNIQQDEFSFVSFLTSGSCSDVFTAVYQSKNVIVKMIKKGLIESLTAMLSHNFEDLLILCITFLKKLSTIEENKNTMKESNIVDLLSKNIPCSSQPLVMITLRFLFNLSFYKV
jgi:hypothetical protein